MGYIEGQDRNQITLFPENIDDYISDHSAVRVIDDILNSLTSKALISRKRFALQ